MVYMCKHSLSFHCRRPHISDLRLIIGVFVEHQPGAEFFSDSMKMKKKKEKKKIGKDTDCFL